MERGGATTETSRGHQPQALGVLTVQVTFRRPWHSVGASSAGPGRTPFGRGRRLFGRTTAPEFLIPNNLREDPSALSF
jgi:hypothetical protein